MSLNSDGLSLSLLAAQREIWFAEQRLNSTNRIYKLGEYTEIYGPVDLLLFEAALRRVVGEADTLHVRFVEDSDGPRQVLEPSTDWLMPVIDVSKEPDPRTAAHAWMAADVARPMVLNRGPLFSFALIKLRPDWFFWYQGYHHIVMDEFGFFLIARRVAEVYTALANGRVCDQNIFGSLHQLEGADAAYRASAQFTQDRSYWMKYFADPAHSVGFADRSPRTPEHYVSRTAYLPQSALDRLQEAARRAGVRWSDMVIAATAAYMQRLTGERDVAVSLPVTARTDAVLERIPGMMSNIVPLRLPVRPDMRPLELIRRVAAGVDEVLAHQRYRAEDIRRDLGLSGSVGSVFGSMINVMSFDYDLYFAGYRTTTHNISLGLIGDLSIVVWNRRDGSGLRIDLQAHPEIYSADDLAAHQQCLLALLDTIVVVDSNRPISRIDLLTAADHDRLLVEYNDSAGPVAEAYLPALFEAQVQATPDAMAVLFEDTVLTYAQLNARANRLARALVARGAGVEQIVALALPPSPEIVIAILAVLKSGAAYLPLDLEYPADRLACMLGDSGAVCVLTVSTAVDQLHKAGALTWLALDDPAITEELATLPDHDLSDADHASLLLAEHPAYVMYTSGSTGRPKGVVVPHRAVVNHMLWMQQAVPLGAQDTVLHRTSVTFDASVWELFAPLLAGARVLVAPAGVHRDPGALAGLVADRGVTVLQVVPSLLGVLLEQPALKRWGMLRRLFCGGEALAGHLWAQCRDRLGSVSVYNLYGPTEVCIDAVFHPCGEERAATSVPIGRPITNIRVYVLDAGLQLVPPGAVGELYLTGAGLARGYVHQPALTAQRFVADPFGAPGARMYRTGDLVRWRADGDLEFVGRVDDQVKIRGYRIEPGEIETVLAHHPDVAQAAVITRQDRPDDKRLVAYIVVGGNTSQVGDQQVAHDQVGEWQQFYDSLHARLGSAVFGQDFTGWNSSYDGQPIPTAHLQEWRERTVARILSLQPRRVLEVGVGTGLLLSQLAPHCDTYWATDFSVPAIDTLTGYVEQDPELARRVVLRTQPAHDTDGLPVGLFDMVILNSIVQYFPTADYLIDVLNHLLRLVAPGGAVFIGDVRNLRLLRCLATAVQLHRADATTDRSVLRRAIEQAVLMEKELLVEPGFFTALQDHVADIGGVDIQLKRGWQHNELNRYRYDVILYKHPVTTLQLGQAPQLSWAQQLGGLHTLDDYLTTARPARLRVTDVPNNRITREAAAAQALQAGSPLADLLDPEPTDTLKAVEPETFHELGQRCGYWVGVTWSATDTHAVDVVFADTALTSSAVPTGLYTPVGDAQTPLASFTNNPTAARGTGALISELRDYLRQHLPEYMIPAALVVLDSLPLTPHGKLDRKGLPAPAFPVGAGRAPRSPQEQILCELFAQVLGLASVGVEDDFFNLGGHSLLATRLISRIRAVLGVELPLSELFKTSTVAGVAARLGQAGPVRLALTRQQRPDRLPLSFAQRRLWFLHQLEGPSPTYNIPLAVKLSGELNREALQAALADVIERHESLRTLFPQVDGVPYQHIVDVQTACPKLTVTETTQTELSAVLAEAARYSFDLAVEPPLRAQLFAPAPDEHVLVLAIHHIAGDGWSMGPLGTDVATAYASRCQGQAPGWAPLPVQYADYTLWQHQLLGDQTDPDSLFATQIGYWTQALAGLPNQLILPTDHPRPPMASHRGENLTVRIDAALHHGLRQLALQAEASMFMVLQAALAALLSKLGAGHDIPIGSPIAGRTDQALDDLVGFFVNTLVLRTDTSGDPSFTQLLARVRETALGAYAHQDLPFDYLVEVLHPTRSLAHHPLFQVMLAVQNFPHTGLSMDLPGLATRPEPVDLGVAKLDLTVNLTEQRGADGTPIGIQGTIEYASDLFDPVTVEKLATRFIRLLDAVVADPDRSLSRIDILTAEDRHQLLQTWNDTATPIPQTCLPELFENQVIHAPEATAVICQDTTLSYTQLNTRANQLSHALITRGIGPEHIVALALPRSPQLIIAVLAVLKTGAAYLPLDPDYPPARLAYMLTDAHSALLITTTHTTGSVPNNPATPRLILDDPNIQALLDTCPDTNPTNIHRSTPLRPEHPAYLIYTSGSTGTPKAVVVSHTGISSLAAAQIDRFGIDACSRVLHFASPSFDASFSELCLGLLSGAALVLAPAAQLLPGAPLCALAHRQSVTHVTLPPSALAVLPAEDGLAASVTVVVAGEACPPALVATWSVNRRLINAYGPTETTVCATMSQPLSDATQLPPPIGQPITNTRVYVLDAWLQPMPAGVAGELYIAGAGLARGYLHRPSLTAQRFLADPYGPAGTRMYRTGDLVRWRTDGNLEFFGRVDDQVKIRGFRIEPGEIETVLATHPNVTQAAVIAREDRPGDNRLTAYVVAATPRTSALINELREYLRQRLPEYMVPAALVVLDALPLTPNGKLNRTALPAPELGSASTGRTPRTPQEQLLCQLFTDVLGVAGIGIDDGFFDVGGHSLLATRLISRMRAVLGVELELRVLFKNPTVAGLAAHLHDAGQARPALTVYERPDVVPLSFAQRRLWFLHQLEGASPTYNIPLALRVSGNLDRQALRAALGDVIARHESLRTIFPQLEGMPYQEVLGIDAARPALSVTHSSETELPKVLAGAARYGFDLASEPPVRAELFALEPDEHVLLVVVHHIAGDGWSMAPLSADLTTAYAARCRGKEPAWAPLPVQYVDYTLWQHQLLGDETDPDSLFATQVSYWTEQLAGLPEQLLLPADRRHPAIASYRGDCLPVWLDAALHQGLVSLARQGGASLFMVLQAGLAALLSRLGAGSDIPVGSPIAGRTDQALDDLIGFFVNTLVLRTDTSGDPTFAQLLTRVRETALAAYAHQDVPFEHLVEVLNPARSLAHQPLFQIMLGLQNTPRASFELPGLDTSFAPVPTATAKFDLSFSLSERRGPDGSPDGIDGSVEYASDLFDPATVETLVARWARLLDAAVADPDRPISRINILTPGERHRLLVDHNDTAHPVIHACLPVLFETQVQATPEAVAVVSGDITLTYSQLNTRANQLAHALIGRGVGPESAVGVLLERSVDLVVSILAVVKAGGTYVPLDTRYPASRMCLVMQETGASVLVTDQAMRAHKFPHSADVIIVDADMGFDEPDPGDPGTATHPEQLAYVMYTSGSTGRPKGIAITHRDVIGLALDPCWQRNDHQRVLLHSPSAFDASTYEIWVPLLNGGQIVVALPGEVDIRTVERVITQHQITSVFLTTALFNLMAEQCPRCFAGTWQVWTGGEMVSPTAIQCVLNACPKTVVVHVYGPTETTTFATYHAMRSPYQVQGTVPIGRPMANMRAYVLDIGMQPLPPGAAGELYIGGVGLARGYVHRPSLTAQRFLADPYGPAGTRMYRTGDLVRWRTDGNLEFLGRVDDQVKIRGFRIEPGEIETVLATHPNVTQAAVIAREDRPGDKRLAAYMVTAKNTDQTRSQQVEQDQVNEWQQIYDSLYATSGSTVFGQDFTGWNSSYHGQPILATHMQEWREQTVARIRSLEPRRVLEVGVGTGLLLSQLAPHCDTYWATDFSAPTIDILTGHLDQNPELAARVVLRAQPAHDTTGLPAGLFDTVILNSIIQYFPTADYLIDVLTRLLHLVTPGGVVFVGDVRNLRLLRTLTTAVQLHRTDPSTDLPTLRRAVEQAILVEKELLVDPDFFPALQGHLTEIAGIDIQIKRGQYYNELTRYRYDVALHKHPITPLPLSHVPQLAWAHQISGLPALEDHLTTIRPARLRLTGVPNHRIAHDTALTQAFQAGSPLADLLSQLHTPNHAPEAVDPEKFHELGQRCGYWVGITWSAPTPHALDIVFADTNQTTSAIPLDLYIPASPTGTPLSSLTNNPTVTRGTSALISELREYLRQRLPEYMVPAALVVLDALPLTPNGKLNRTALPAPELGSASTGRAPRTLQEQLLCQLFAEVLGLPEVGVDDDFFDLGGHSLLANRLVSRVRDTLGVELGLRSLFEAPTPAGLATRLHVDDPNDAFEVILPLRSQGCHSPLFCIHPGGGLSWSYSGLIKQLGPDYPIYGVQARGLARPEPRPTSIEEMAADYIDQIRTVQPAGPYCLLGWSFGGLVAHAIATGLQQRDAPVALLVILDTYPMCGSVSRTDFLEHERDILIAMIDCDLESLEGEPLTFAKTVEILRSRGGVLANLNDYHVSALVENYDNSSHLALDFTPGRFHGNLLLFTSTMGRGEETAAHDVWRPYIDGTIEIHNITSGHVQMMEPESLAQIGPILAAKLHEITRGTS